MGVSVNSHVCLLMIASRFADEFCNSDWGVPNCGRLVDGELREYSQGCFGLLCAAGGSERFGARVPV